MNHVAEQVKIVLGMLLLSSSCPSDKLSFLAYFKHCITLLYPNLCHNKMFYKGFTPYEIKTHPIEHQVSALASDLSIEFRYDTNASCTLPRLEKHLKEKKKLFEHKIRSIFLFINLNMCFKFFPS